MRERELRVERECRGEMTFRFADVEAIERVHTEQVLAICVRATGAERSEASVGRRGDGEHAARERGECEEQRVLVGRLLFDRAHLVAGAHVDDGGDESRRMADLDEVAHDEIAGAGASRERKPIVQGEGLSRACRRSVAQQVGDALVVHDADVGPAPQVEREQVDARVAQPVEVLRSGDVGERHDHPDVLVNQRGWSARQARYSAARRRRAVGALSAEGGCREGEQQSGAEREIVPAAEAGLTHGPEPTNGARDPLPSCL